MRSSTPGAAHSGPAISITAATRTFPDGSGGRVRAVDGASLEVARGEVVALLGPNGAGKSTLIDLILGLGRPESGTVAVCGEAPRLAARGGRLGAVLQTGGLLADLTVRETVELIAALHENPLSVDEAMRTAGVEGFAKRKVVKCSGGQRQRLKFALALLPRPDVLVLDEPTAGMDVTARGEFWGIVAGIARSGTAVLFATHYLEEAERYASRTVLLAEGRVIADGPTAKVRSAVGRAHVTATWRPTAEELAALPAGTSHEADGDVVELRTDRPDELARHLLNHTSARSLGIRQAGLEEAFTHLTAAERKDTDR